MLKFGERCLTLKKQTRMGLSLLVVFLLVLTTFTGFIPSTGVNAQENVQASGQIIDIQGHWAQAQIADWVEKGLARGYNDGTFKPDKSITRAEFITLVNKAFGFTKKSQINFKDVSTADWYSEEIAKAAAEGYITGYEDGTIKPGNEITRQEVAVILSKVMKLKTDETKATDKFKDASRIPGWSKPYIDTIVRNGYIGGYPDGTIQPSRSISRAESIIMLDRAIGTLYNAAGTYGPSDGENTISGNVTINTTGVTLQNTVIEGNLYLTAGIGDGDVYLNNVVVKGKTIVAGGGENSIHFTNFTGGEIVVIKVGGKVRMVAAGDTQIDQVEFESGGTIEGQGISEVYVLKPGEEVILNGDFEKVVLKANAEVKVTDKTTIEKLEIADTAKQAKVDIAENCTVKTLTLNAPARITGKGKIEKAEINADGAVIEQKPEKVEVAEGVKANVGGKEVSGGTTTSSGGSSGSGGGGSTQPSKAAINSITVTNGTITVAFSKTVTGLTLNDFNITAELDERTYTLQNLTYNDSSKTFTFTPIPQTNKQQTLEIAVAAASSSTKITGSASDTVTIEALPEEKGSIEGTVTSAVYGERPIEGATITILNTDFSVTTDVYGKYSISNIPVGTYSIKAAKAGYQAQTKEVQVENGKTTTVDFELEKEEAGDTTPPIFVETYPKIENVAQTSFVLVVETNEEATLYWAVLPESEEAPTAEQVKNIINFIDSGHFVYVDGKYSWLQPNESCRITISSQNFEPGKTYYVYVVAEDAAQNLQAEPVKLTVTLTEAEPQDSTIEPTTAVFDKNTSSADYKDIAVTMTLNGNTLIAIKNGEAVLVQDTDYMVEGNLVTIKKEYLTTQAVGNITLTFEFSAGNPATLIVTVSDSAPLEAAFEATGNIGAQEGKIYEEYRLKADGKVIDLSTGNIKSIKVVEPDATEAKELTPNTDSTLWFNVQKLSGDYKYTVVDNNDITYTATLTWTAPTKVTAEATGNAGDYEGNYYVEYKLGDLDLSSFDKMYQIKPDGTVIELTANTDQNLWFKTTGQIPGTHTFLVKKDGAWYVAEIEWTAATEAAFEAVNSFGIHDGKVYAGYELQDEAGNQIALVASNIESITVKNPDGSTATLTVVDDSDPYLWFNVEKTAGDYVYTVVTKGGKTYEATLTWAAPKTATWEATNREGVHDGITYVEYKLMDGENQVSLKEGEVKLIASKDSEGKWVALEPNTDETLWFNKAHETGNYEFIVVTNANTIYKATLAWT
ncbi:PEGA domain-containing protein [Thermoanaerobacteraceae bacterium SP2]|nr:PEGA domain-containing protein [Thermoanaerobacteraceae bacterium SP2]